jgi:hypothetical protein
MLRSPVCGVCLLGTFCGRLFDCLRPGNPRSRSAEMTARNGTLYGTRAPRSVHVHAEVLGEFARGENRPEAEPGDVRCS